jgi:soluble lytic murein transglycosylase
MTTGSLARSLAIAAAGLGLAVAAGAGLMLARGSSGAEAQAHAVVTAAAAPTPRLAPAELSRIRAAFAAADAGRWMDAEAERAAADDPLARRLIAWRIASDPAAPADFTAIAEALRELKGWPGRVAMKRRAESQAFDAPLSPAERIVWLRSDGGPESGDGEMALAQALAQTGAREEATALARRVWRERALTPRAEALALASFGGAFTAQDHADRVDRLLWRGDRSSATRLLSRLPTNDRLVAEARIGLQQRRSKGLQALVDRVPTARRDDAGLLFDRIQYIRRTGRPEAAMPLAIRLDPMTAAAAAREEIAEERRLYVPRALRGSDPRGAYRLVTNHGLKTGVAFADSEWMAGWIALKFLDDPATAARHFATLAANVSTPVSRSRALYWQAQAAKATDQRDAAAGFLTEAAALDYTFYGQLAAAERFEAPMLQFKTPGQIPAEARARFEAREIVRVLRILSDMDDRRTFEAFAFALDDELTEPAEHEMLAELARARGFHRTAVRSAKAGIRRGIVAEAAFPLMSIPPEARGTGRPEPALIHAITRQESEFDPQAVSPAGARGLMQVMPATAKLVASRIGAPYDRTRLLTDPAYNVTLGSAYLGELIESFGGSYVLAIASYNAGPNRTREWIANWGDPRTGAVSTVDWIELIPFGETRNYVMRVMENLQVYRYRSAGRPTPITLLDDLERGAR